MRDAAGRRDRVDRPADSAVGVLSLTVPRARTTATKLASSAALAADSLNASMRVLPRYRIRANGLCARRYSRSPRACDGSIAVQIDCPTVWCRRAMAVANRPRER